MLEEGAEQAAEQQQPPWFESQLPTEGLTCAVPTMTGLKPARPFQCRPTDCGPAGSPAHEGFRGWIRRPAATRGVAPKIYGRGGYASGCAVSERYRFVYVHVLKSGGMTMKSLLKDTLCGTHKVTAATPCPGGADLLRITTCHRAISAHPDFLVFSVVRNPFARAVSAYAMAKFPEDVTFEQFAQSPRGLGRRTWLSSSHWSPQVDFLLTREGCPVVDFLASMDRLHEDLAKVFRVIGSPELLARVTAPNGVWHATDTNFGARLLNATGSASPLRDKYTSEGDAARLGVARHFRNDFELLGYDPETVPPRET